MKLTLIEMDILRRRSFIISVIAFLAVTFLLSYLFVDSRIFGRRAPFFTSEQTAKKFIPEDLRLGVLKAESLFNAGKREDAISVLRTLGGRYPDEADVHYVLATYLLVDATYTRGREYKDVQLVHTNVDEGLSHLRRAADLAPKKKEYLYTYAIGLGFYPDSPDTSIKPIMGQEVCHGNTQEVLSGVQARSRPGGQIQSAVNESGGA